MITARDKWRGKEKKKKGECLDEKEKSKMCDKRPRGGGEVVVSRALWEHKSIERKKKRERSREIKGGIVSRLWRFGGGSGTTTAM